MKLYNLVCIAIGIISFAHVAIYVLLLLILNEWDVVCLIPILMMLLLSIAGFYIGIRVRE
jgi:hypothetical protein